jgi:hypothetical protein
MAKGVWIVLQLRRQDLLVLAVCVHPIMHLFHTRHDLVSHVQSELPHFALFDELPMLPLPLASGSANPISSRGLLWAQILA